MTISQQDTEVANALRESIEILVKAMKSAEQKRVWRTFENELDTEESQDDGNKVR